MEDAEGIGGLRRRVDAARQRLARLQDVCDMPFTKARLALLEQEAAQGGLWDDASRAQALMAQITALRADVGTAARFQAILEEAEFALELLDSTEGISPEEQSSMQQEALAALAELNTQLDAWEVRRLLSGPYDERDARVTINAGAGGVDAMDWAAMLERMFCRWAERRGLTVRTVERSPGDEAGLKSVELEVGGRFAYGFLRGEKGTHRLVRNSPFNAKGLRQTSFAGVEVLPDITDLQVDLDMKEGDLQFSFMRSGGAGGQNVNKVETGVRVTHAPTGITVKCTQERTQVRNKQIALDMLKAKLLVVMQEQAAQQVAQIRGDVVKAEWGQQIRNYVLHPYKLVKDTRTGLETSDVDGVLDGDLQPFIEAYLRWRGQAGASAALAAEPGGDGM